MSSFCSVCGAEISTRAKFCTGCGAVLNATPGAGEQREVTVHPLAETRLVRLGTIGIVGGAVSPLAACPLILLNLWRLGMCRRVSLVLLPVVLATYFVWSWISSGFSVATRGYLLIVGAVFAYLLAHATHGRLAREHEAAKGPYESDLLVLLYFLGASALPFALAALRVAVRGSI